MKIKVGIANYQSISFQWLVSNIKHCTMYVHNVFDNLTYVHNVLCDWRRLILHVKSLVFTLLVNLNSDLYTVDVLPLPAPMMKKWASSFSFLFDIKFWVFGLFSASDLLIIFFWASMVPMLPLYIDKIPKWMQKKLRTGPENL